jgi:hypothetical protein
MQRFKPPESAQRHLISRLTLRTFRAQGKADWNAAAAAA